MIQTETQVGNEGGMFGHNKSTSSAVFTKPTEAQNFVNNFHHLMNTINVSQDSDQIKSVD